jgi:hypothetical protein
MSKPWKQLLEALYLLILGFLVIVCCFIVYLMIYLSVEELFYHENVQLMPAGTLRISSCLLLVVVYFWVLKTKLSDFIKAFLLCGPLTVTNVTVVLTFYDKLYIAIPLVSIIFLTILGIVYKTKQSWYYYPIIVMSLIIGLLYAWPR